MLLIGVLRLSAQSMSVESFRLLENDLTANTYGTMEYDQNGQTAALIKVSTLEKGFVFDGGMLGIVKTEQKVGEVWVYVPFGLQRITIAHPDFGVLRDYYFPISIQKARTYEMVLKTVRPEREPEREEVSLSSTVNVRFENKMSTSDIYLNGIKLATGSWSGNIAATTYLIEVKQSGYKTYTNTVTLRPSEQVQVINIPSLERITGTVSVTSEPSGAQIYFDNQYGGTTPFKKEKVLLGTHTVEVRKSGYNVAKRPVYITGENSFQSVNVVLEKIKYLDRNNFYFGAAYQFGHLESITGIMGFYAANFNLEVGVGFPRETPQKIYWLTNPEGWSGTTYQDEYDYNIPVFFRAALGYGLRMGNYFRLTPQVGIQSYRIEGTSALDQSINSRQLSYVMSAQGILRWDCVISRHIALTLTQSYEKSVKRGELAEALENSTDFMKKWVNGVTIKAGLEIYF